MFGDSTGPRPSAVNELDLLSIGKKTHDDGSKQTSSAPRERITCTLDTRGSGPPARRVNIANNRNGFGENRRLGQRLTFPGRRSDDFPERNHGRRFEPSDSRRDRSFGDIDRRERERRDPVEEEKPVLKLVDPASVPRGRGYFDHDSREKDEWHGKSLYDPRKDFGFNRQRDRGGRRDFGGWQDRDNREDRPRFQRSSWGGPKTGIDGDWSHDKFFEMEGIEDPQKANEELAKTAEKKEESSSGPALC
ncbi:unnamed protein product, partial [Mesorhabditis spiculigera]